MTARVASFPVASFFDTSVLIAAHDASRPGHEASLRLMQKAARDHCACAAHSLAEFYSVLSRLPGGWRQRPDFAGTLTEEIASRVTVVALTAQEYLATLQSAARLRIAGGAVYDALLLACARKVNAERIYSWNERHFKLVAPDLAERIGTP
ncbi:MAG: PIN domain-containing protein [Terracidiphilus sp.]|jgi:predicted nucleic acid-binding protein